VGRATEKTVDATPMTFFADSPVFVKDKNTDGYIRTCQGTRAGDPADATYLSALPTAMIIDEAANAYHTRNYVAAKKLYQTAASMPAGAQKRVITGLYLTSWKLRQTKDAEAAFTTLVSSAMDEKRLGMKFLFQPGSTNFVADTDLRMQYAIWTKIIGTNVAKRKNCLTVVGHTSRSGTEPANEALSTKRAQAMVNALERNGGLRNRLTSQGVGSREAIVGSGTDDLRDAIDRRVDFRVVDCVV
jgi:outer membrane protein OmpA-like peptidoglycan-associated protein